MSTTEKPYGVAADGQQITRYVCTNANGYSFELIDYGATLIAVNTPDRSGQFENIALSCKDIQGYETCTSYFGATVGRVCNRIAKGKFSINGTEYSLAVNNGPNHLHGGLVGFDKRIWNCESIDQDRSVGIRCTLVSEDGDEGYPGTVSVTAEYSLNDENELTIRFEASTDAATHVNLTNHCYWNLAGEHSGSVLEQELLINADRFLPLGDDAIPCGETAAVANSSFDFRQPKKIGQDYAATGMTLKGYDHCYLINAADGELQLAAIASDPQSGRRMEILTTQPSLQFYTGNFLDGQPGSGGFDIHSGFCIEAQNYPDAANQPAFPTTLLQSGETYRQTTIHRFSVDHK